MLEGINFIGGITGYSNATILNCLFDGSIEGLNNLGGIVGYNYDNSKVINCYNIGNINGNSQVGGIVGYNTGSISNCYNIGTIKGEDHYIGGVSGTYYGNISNCYYLTGCAKDGNDVTQYGTGIINVGSTNPDINGQTNAILTSGLISATADITIEKESAEAAKSYVVKNNDTLVSALNGFITTRVTPLNFYTWINDDNYAKFGQIVSQIWDGTIDTEFSGTGTESDPYLITSASELAGLAKNVNEGNDYSGKYFKLTDDIELNDTTNWENWDTTAPTNEWIQIGHIGTSSEPSKYFKGNFDGDNHIVSGIYINKENDYQLGLFVSISGSNIKDIKVINSYIKGASDVGGIVGRSLESVISNCSFEGVIDGNNYTGGIVGHSYDTTIINCVFDGDITGSNNIGGIVGSNQSNSKVINCYNKGNVNSIMEAGGIAGRNNGSIINCYNIGTIRNTLYYIGGVSGTYYGNISNCYYLTGCAKNGNDVIQYGIGASNSEGTTSDIYNNYNDFNCLAFSSITSFYNNQKGFNGSTTLEDALDKKAIALYQNYNEIVSWEVEDDNVVLSSDIDITIYQLSLNDNGGEYNDYTKPTIYYYGLEFTLPTSDVISKSGYTFDGWFIDDDFSNNKVEKILSTDSGDKVFYAKWILNAPVITNETGYIETFDDESHEISVTASHEDSSLITSLEYQWYKGGIESSNLLTGKTSSQLQVKDCSDSGDYYCVIKISNGTENKTVTSNKITVKIDKAKITKPTEDPTVFVYNKEEQTYTVASNDAYTVTNNKRTDAGSQDVSVELIDKVNYEWSDETVTNITFTFVISKASVTEPTNSDAGSKSYTGSLLKSDISSNTYYNITTNNGGTDVNSYDVIVTLKDNTNYKWATGADTQTRTVKFTITKANNSVGNVNISDWTYGQTPSSITATATFGTVTYKYYNEQEVELTTIPTNAGVYKVKAYVEGTSNYNECYSGSFTTFKIKKVQVTKPTEDTTVFVYNKEEQTYTVASNDNYTVTNNKRTDAGSQDVNVELIDKVNYEWNDETSANITFTFVIEKASVTEPTNSDAGSKAYTGSLLKSDITSNTYYDVTTNNGGTDVNSYDVILTLKDNTNYKWATGADTQTRTVKFTITKANNNVGNVSISDWTYGQTPSSITATATFGTVTYKYYNEQEVELTTIPTNTGVYKVKAYVEGTSNYNECYSGSFTTFKIKKAQVTKHTEDTTIYVYNKEEQTYTVVANDAYTVNNNVQKDPGSYLVTIELIDKLNYEWSDKTTTNLNYQFIIRNNEFSSKLDEESDELTVVVNSKNGFDYDSTINISIVPNEEATNIESNIEKSDKVVIVYDIKLFKNNNIIEPNGKLTIRFIIPLECKDKNFKLVHVCNDEVKIMEYTIDGDYVVIETNELSQFIFVVDDKGSIVWLILVLLAIFITECVFVGLKLMKDSPFKKKKVNSFIPLVILAYIPAGQIVFVIILAILCIAGGLAVAYFYYFKDRINNKEVTIKQTDRENTIEEKASVEENVVQEQSDFEISNEETLIGNDSVSIDDVDEEDAVVLKEVEEQTGLAVLIRYRKSFIAKYIQAPDNIKEYYKLLKNTMLSYENVISRVSWNFDSINFEKEKIAKFNVSGKTLCLYLAFDPNDCISSNIKVDKVEIKKYADTSYLFQINNDKDLKDALELIKYLMKKFNILKGEDQNKNYYLPFETIDALVIKGLIKEFITKVKYEDYLKNQDNQKSK